MISPCANPNIDLGPYAGVEILCIFFAMALWGATCVQTFLYFFNNRGCGATTVLVMWIWVMDTIHQCLLMAGSYKGNVSGEIYLTNNVRVEFVIQMLFTSLVSIPIQVFFIYRIWRFAKRPWIIPVLAVPVILFEFAEGIMIVVFNVHAKSGSELTEPIEKALFISNFVVGSCIDIVVSATLSAMLYGVYLKGSAEFPRTVTLLHRLILFSIFTGMWTALVAIAAMVMEYLAKQQL
ncbi:hypothetical protein BDZ94DRAFT_985909 [Collybia nuda]|uniref:Uncharacterized protein n=1 Tax=Collybia nuda TaxID=64659 RepID=A0A9P5Y214_9AGAR|nr:hypothetical protein BDZ94DRAFT_985909 [Collybia nuda]